MCCGGKAKGRSKKPSEVAASVRKREAENSGFSASKKTLSNGKRS